MTDSTGTASCTVTLGDPAGPYTAAASFSTDGVYSASSDSAPFTVNAEETTMAYNGPTVILASGSGATLTAQLVEDGTNDTDGDGGSPGPVPARDGHALARVAIVHRPDRWRGQRELHDRSDDRTRPADRRRLVRRRRLLQASERQHDCDRVRVPEPWSVHARRQDRQDRGTTGATVTWWADTWSSLNSLSGGAAPASGKGFAGKVSLPTSTPPAVCGGNWTTTAGNSPPPTSGVPSYMGTLVTSKVTKNGSTIAGNTVHIVVVKTNPGYAPDPSHHGTGVIVATYC